MKQFRNLRADEIDVRVQSVTEKGFILLLYKDARADMTILDEVVGPMNWKREHTRDNANCIVSIWCDDKKQWIGKEDTGTESNSDKEKGLASDSFKRACFNWGIGRELYSSPFTWVSDKSYISEYNGRKQVKEKFKVSEIEYEGKNIIKIKISDSEGKEVFSYGCGYKKKEEKKPEEEKKHEEKPKCEDKNKDKEIAIKMIKNLCDKNGLKCDVERLEKMSSKELKDEYDLLKK